MYLCEGEKAWLQCQQFELLRIKRVYWGRDNDKMCPKIPPGLSGENCDAEEENAFDKVEQQCRHDQACEVVASNVFFDDNTCKNTYKFLKICYDCVPDSLSNRAELLRSTRERKKRGKRGEFGNQGKFRGMTPRQIQEERMMDSMWEHPLRAPLLNRP